MRLLLLASLLLIPFPAAAQMQDPILNLAGWTGDFEY